MIDLVYVLFALVALSMTAQSAIPVIVMLCMAMVHNWLPDVADGNVYYLTAALADWLCIVIVGKLTPVTKTALIIQAISLISVLVNAIGWIFWVTFQSPELYNAIYAALYIVGLLMLTSVDGGRNVGGSSNNRRNHDVSGNFFSRCQSGHHYINEVRT